MSSYMTNTSVMDIGDEELIQKNAMLQQQVDQLRQELEDQEKSAKELQRKLDSMKLDLEHQTEVNKNNEGLISFYKNQANSSSQKTATSENDLKVSDLEVKLLTAEERVDECEEQIKDLQKEITTLKSENSNLNETNEKIINLLTEKQLELESLQEKLKGEGGTPQKEETPQKEGEKDADDDEIQERLNTEETKELKKMYEDTVNEYENYRQESENEINKLSKEIEELQLKEHEMKSKLIDLDNENNKLRDDIQVLEVEKLHLESEQKKIDDENNNKNGFLQEIEYLQNQIQELKDSKEKIIMNSDQAKKDVIVEKNEIQTLYQECQQKNIELEKQMNNLRLSSQRELNVVQEKAKNDLNQKENEIIKIKEHLKKTENKIEALKKDIDKKDAELLEFKESLSQSKKQCENEKKSYEKERHELETKFGIEKSALTSRLSEQATKIEDLTKQLSKLQQQTQYASNSNGFKLDDVLEDSNQKSIEEKEKQIKELTAEKKVLEKNLAEARTSVATLTTTSEGLKAENDCLNKNLESIKKKIDALNAQKEKEEQEFKAEAKTKLLEISQLKTELATITFDHETELMKWKRHVKRMAMKLQQFGVTFSKKK